MSEAAEPAQGGTSGGPAWRQRQLTSFAELLESGRRLTAVERSRLEPAVRRDLADLIVHDGDQATRLTRRLQASAFAVGRRVFVPGGVGEGLLAHEAAHVAQQTAPAAVARLPLALPTADRSAGVTSRRPVVQPQAAEPGGAAGREAEANAAAEAVDGTRSQREEAQEVDLDPLTDRVYALLSEEALVERERFGGH